MLSILFVEEQVDYMPHVFVACTCQKPSGTLRGHWYACRKYLKVSACLQIAELALALARLSLVNNQPANGSRQTVESRA